MRDAAWGQSNGLGEGGEFRDKGIIWSSSALKIISGQGIKMAQWSQVLETKLGLSLITQIPMVKGEAILELFSDYTQCVAHTCTHVHTYT